MCVYVCVYIYVSMFVMYIICYMYKMNEQGVQVQVWFSLQEKIRAFDSKYLRKIFERYPEARDEEILHTFKRLQYR